MSCAVTADLNRHLAEVDEASSRAEGVEMLADQWLSHPEKIRDAWTEVLTDIDLHSEFLNVLSERSLRSGRFSGMSEEVAESLFLSKIDEMMKEAMSDMADSYLEDQAEQNALDAALNAAEEKEYWRDRG